MSGKPILCPVCRLRGRDVNAMLTAIDYQVGPYEADKLMLGPESWGRKQMMDKARDMLEENLGMIWQGDLPRISSSPMYVVYCPECGFHGKWSWDERYAVNDFVDVAQAVELVSGWKPSRRLRMMKDKEQAK